MKKFSQRELNEQRHFDRIAYGYDDNYSYDKPFTKYKIDKKSREFVRLVKNNLRKKNLKILEIGCGTGEYTRQIATRLPKTEIIGLDISQKIINIARKKCKPFANISFVVQSAYDTSFKKNAFDIVCGFYVLHHLNIPKAIKEFVRVLKPGGILFFYEPNILNPIVFLIKSSKTLKKRVGDSPDEWAINPLTIHKQLSTFEVIKIAQTEFILPLYFVPFSLLKIADEITSYFRFIPLLKFFGGSVTILVKN